MNQREKLIELLRDEQRCEFCNHEDNCETCYPAETLSYGAIADRLLVNGVIVPPCKVGDTVYRISQKFYTKTKYVQKTKISRIAIDDDGIWLFCECNPTAKCIFGKTVFLTHEEAESELERMNDK